MQGTLGVPIPPRLRVAAGGADVRYYWADCSCEEERRETSARRAAAFAAERRMANADALLASAGLDQVEGFTLDRFNPNVLEGDEDSHPYHIATRWLAQIADQSRADYANPGGPPAALFFYCPGKGRGKTHLAAALAWEQRRTHELACFLHEEAFTSRLWACTFEERASMITVPGQQAWLTVIDDLGRINPGPGVQNAWYTVVNRRWLARRWTVFTSNFTLEELERRGTICDATRSRITQMTRGEYVYFDGEDQRLAGL